VNFNFPLHETDHYKEVRNLGSAKGVIPRYMYANLYGLKPITRLSWKLRSVAMKKIEVKIRMKEV
jgi:hypothetical protein